MAINFEKFLDVFKGSGSESRLPIKVRQAAGRFKKHRADYYVFMAAMLRSSGGSIKILDLFSNDIVRYENTPRGVLSEYWYDRYSSTANLADALDGTLPDDELALIRVSQSAGGDALILALEDVARMSKLSGAIQKETMGTLMAGFIAILIAGLMVTVFPVFSIKTIGDSYDFIPKEYWGKSAKSLLNYSAWIKSNIIYILSIFAFILYSISWTISNLIGPVREWLDEHIVLYRVLRDLKGAMFLTTMSTLTRRRSGVMFTTKQSLEIFSDSARSPWLKWRINEVIDGADTNGSLGVQSFRTGLISKEMFFFLEDMQKAKGFADGFEETGRYVESVVVSSITNKLTFYRWMMLLAALVISFAMFSWQFSVINEMRGAMQTYMSAS